MAVNPCVAIETDRSKTREPNPVSDDFLVENGAGRLICTRVGKLDHPRQVGQIEAAMFNAFQRTGGHAIICTDWRAIHVFSPGVADALVSMLSKTNRHVQRGAILLGEDNPTLGLQVERVLRAANNPVRRTFRAADRLLAWLGELLTPPELECARKFLRTESTR